MCLKNRNSSARAIRKTALCAYRGCCHCFTHKRAAICMAELVTLYNEKLNSLFRLCYT